MIYVQELQIIAQKFRTRVIGRRNLLPSVADSQYQASIKVTTGKVHLFATYHLLHLSTTVPKQVGRRTRLLQEGVVRESNQEPKKGKPALGK